jgi:hypothetical protein
METDNNAVAWWIDGKPYNFSEWQFQHPGGSSFLMCFNRDISAGFHAYHRDPKKLEALLKTFEMKDTKGLQPPHIAAPWMNVPEFALPPGFNCETDVPEYEWNSKFMDSLRERINTKEMRAKIKQANIMFDRVTLCIVTLHILLSFPILAYELLPAWMIVALLVFTRTAGACIGHYHCHRTKDGRADWLECLFDWQYVALHMTLVDAHVLMHHFYTDSPADAKPAFFDPVHELPSLWRIPVFTLHKFFAFLTGVWVRNIGLLADRGPPPDIGPRCEGKEMPIAERPWQWACWSTCNRILMTSEFVFACMTGHASVWFCQFFATMWVNLLLIGASHDFYMGERERKHCGPKAEKVDWGIYNIEHCIDLHVTGFPFLDCFLTAGLGNHRVHHVLPWLGSAYSEIVAESALKATCKEFGVEWKPSLSFYGKRIWQLIPFYIFSPAVPASEAAKVILSKDKGKGKGKDGKDTGKGKDKGDEKKDNVINRRLTAEDAPKPFVEENFSLNALMHCLGFIWYGVIGLGSA